MLRAAGLEEKPKCEGKERAVKYSAMSTKKATRYTVLKMISFNNTCHLDKVTDRHELFQPPAITATTSTEMH